MLSSTLAPMTRSPHERSDMRVRIVGRTPDIAPLIRATISGEQIAGAGAGRGIDDLIMAGWPRCRR